MRAFPGAPAPTRAELVRYWTKIAPQALPYIARWLLSSLLVLFWFATAESRPLVGEPDRTPARFHVHRRIFIV